jgi:hypothetical protein
VNVLTNEKISELVRKLVNDIEEIELWLEENELPETQTFHALMTYLDNLVKDVRKLEATL